jgi:NADPH:quinone reductase-like Zn-dependent oxidoreductase
MKAAVTSAEHGFDVVDLPDPVPGPEELLIRVAACGVCGSDIKAQPSAPPGWRWAMNWDERTDVRAAPDRRGLRECP